LKGWALSVAGDHASTAAGNIAAASRPAPG
jgi:hypothetical protein